MAWILKGKGAGRHPSLLGSPFPISGAMREGGSCQTPALGPHCHLPFRGTHAPAFTLMDATSLLPQPMACSDG